jgi:hypothetical protein
MTPRNRPARRAVVGQGRGKTIKSDDRADADRPRDPSSMGRAPGTLDTVVVSPLGSSRSTAERMSGQGFYTRRTREDHEAPWRKIRCHTTKRSGPRSGPDGAATANLRGPPWSSDCLRDKIEERVNEPRDFHSRSLRGNHAVSATRTPRTEFRRPDRRPSVHPRTVHSRRCVQHRHLAEPGQPPPARAHAGYIRRSRPRSPR